MPGPITELRILHPKAVYPDTFGGNLRTINIARLAMGVFHKTTLFSMDNAVSYEGTVDGVPVIQEQEFRNGWERIVFYFHAVTAETLIKPYAQRAFSDKGNSLFQIEDPLLYPLLEKNRISGYILDEHNINWELYGPRQSDLKKRIYARVARKRDKANEKRALLNAAHILCCSVRDRDILVQEVPVIEDRITVIPNCVHFRQYPDPGKAPGEASGSPGDTRILFVGTLSHPPNAEAARRICDTIAPQSPYRFIIAGKNPPKVVCPGNAEFTGYVPDIRRLIAGADICIAPIGSGSGTRLKILEYLAMGKPVIATSKGAEGIDYTDGRNIIIEDSIGNFPGVIQGLLEDKSKCASLGREARALIRDRYDWELYREPLQGIYRRIVEEWQ